MKWTEWEDTDEEELLDSEEEPFFPLSAEQFIVGAHPIGSSFL